jgi:hypothetical protein
MSDELQVYLERTRVPTPQGWSAALAAEGFDIKIDPEADLLKQGGFMYAWHDGKRTGFEFDVGPIEEADLPEEVEELAPRDVEAHFRFLREDEVQVAYPSAIVLALACDGIFFDPQEEMSFLGRVDLSVHLERYKPGYWLSQDPRLGAVPGRGKMSAEKLVAVRKTILRRVERYESDLQPFATKGLEKKIFEGAPIVELATIPVAAIHQIEEQGLSYGNLGMVAQAIRAIDRVSPHLADADRTDFQKLRQLCEEVLAELGFRLEQ